MENHELTTQECLAEERISYDVVLKRKKKIKADKKEKNLLDFIIIQTAIAIGILLAILSVNVIGSAIASSINSNVVAMHTMEKTLCGISEEAVGLYNRVLNSILV